MEQSEMNMMQEMMIQILKNQYVLLASSQMNNMSDMEGKVELFESASSHGSETRFLLDKIEKERKNR